MQMLHSGIAGLSIVQSQNKFISLTIREAETTLLIKDYNMALTVDSSFAKPAAFGGIFAALNKLTEAMQRRRVYRTTMNELSALSDRDLSDLGVSRASIRRLALDAANAL
ncbi:DUF1127 domain-containing protein [bacterium]|nr:DUF1127 domain-containing protein [bacterium]